MRIMTEEAVLRLDTSLAEGYTSAPQRVRVMTEHWVGLHVPCPACGGHLVHYPNNRKVADFFCPSCRLDFELKSGKGPMPPRVPDGAYDSMVGRIRSSSAPAFFFLQYDTALNIRNLFVTPPHFLTEQIIERRAPLSDTSRRAGWVGCNIITDHIPSGGRIFYVRDGERRPMEEVRAQYHSTAFLSGQSVRGRGWLVSMMACIEELPDRCFSLADLYRFVPRLQAQFPRNRHIEDKIRQQLQVLRDNGYLIFEGRGMYRRV